MANQISKEVICPKCSKGNKINMYIDINNTLSPECKELILHEELFDWQCEYCQYTAQLSYPLLFIDNNKKYVLALTPRAGKADSVKSNKQLEPYIKRRVKSLAELKEKILILDAGLDDMAIELVKITLSKVLKETYNTEKIKLYFSKIKEDTNFEFAVFVSGKKEAWYQATKASLYNQSLDLVKNSDYKEENEFIRVGPALAAELLKQYE